MHKKQSQQATVTLFAVVLVFLLSAGAIADGRFSQLGQEKVAASTQRTKVAGGEYAVFERAKGGAVGPFGEEVYNFRETWTLWRTPKGGCQVEGERRFESPTDVPHTSRFVAQLSRDLHLL
jgi:hypothetical protein